MKINGLTLREVIKLKRMELVAVLSTFDEALYAFSDEKKESPTAIVEKAFILEKEITRLQTLQSIYNLQITVDLGTDKLKLEHAVKLIGGVGRLAKNWRSASKGSSRDRYDRHSIATRSKDDESAKPTITKAEALEQAKKYEKLASQLRSAITAGNLTEIEIDEIDAKLFE